MINVHWCNNVIRDYSSIREVSHLRYRYRIDLCFGISCRWCHSSTEVVALKVTSVMSRLMASPVALDASKLVPVLVLTNGESFI